MRRLRSAWYWKVWPWTREAKLLLLVSLPGEHTVNPAVVARTRQLARERGLLP